jgi:hypothetical protein
MKRDKIRVVPFRHFGFCRKIDEEAPDSALPVQLVKCTGFVWCTFWAGKTIADGFVGHLEAGMLGTLSFVDQYS